MNGLTKRLMMNKLKNLDTNEVLKYARQYNISISPEQATSITAHLNTSNYDPTKAEDRTRMIKKLAQLTDLKTAKACQQLFQQLIKEYGLEHYFQ
ncbi:DUF2624 domain-containing protein [Gracilibacillus caseinilyticus]|uniref:DUF2624 domain-containing protein n=1 Tax=Gracilibacillus caseinilyticus TaxID=2932256 RepID=A0ABY4EUF9_9BACI|nr:DUF2624 family protein [Gracilibacillus caseinilyticus]UOQ47432.1 DUF2624 domain-containing protein [Gracilibacillus caseinilyticus]